MAPKIASAEAICKKATPPIMTLKSTDLAKRQGLTIAHRMKNATKADLAKKTGKGKDGIKTNPLLQSILGKVNKDGNKD